MPPRSRFVFTVVLTGIVIAGGAALARQWQQSMELRGVLKHARSEAKELVRLRDENQRLRAQQISAAELERLRSDHSALPRLRAELEGLQPPKSATR